MGENSCLADGVNCYSVGRISIGASATVSQHSYLCTASRDYTDPAMPLMVGPIIIGERAWITADVFVGPGVTIGDGAVVLARSSVFKDIDPWIIARGNPAVTVKPRSMKNRQSTGRG